MAKKRAKDEKDAIDAKAKKYIIGKESKLDPIKEEDEAKESDEEESKKESEEENKEENKEEEKSDRH